MAHLFSGSVAPDRYGPAVQDIAGLVGYWRLSDTGSAAADSSGNGRTGTAAGGPARGVLGIPGVGTDRATSFDGTDDKITVPFHASLNPAQFTVAAWARVGGGANNRWIVGSTSNNATRGWSIFINASGVVSAQLGTGASWTVINSALPASTTGYTFVVLTYNGTTMRLYVDGLLAGSVNPGAYVSNTSGALRIGHGEDGIGDNYRWTGPIDEVSVWNVVLTADQIAALAVAGALVQTRTISQQRRGAVSVSAELWLADRYGTKIRRLDGFLSDGASAKIIHSVDKEPKTELQIAVSKRAGLRPFADWVIPVLTVRWSGGLVEGPRDMGHFVVVPPPLVHTAGDSLETITAMDWTYILKLATYKRGRSFPVGMTYHAGIMEVLDTIGVPASRVKIPFSPLTIPKKANFRPGQDKLGVVNQFLEAMGYYSITADLDGYLVSWPYIDLHTVEPAVIYTEDDVLSDPVKEEPDMTRFCNTVVVRRIQTGKPTIYAVAINDRDESPASTYGLGGGAINLAGNRVRVEVTRVIDDNEVPTNAAAQIIANKYRDEGESYYQRMTFRSKPSTNLGFHQTIGLHLSNPAGEVSAGTFYRQSWSLGFTANTAAIEQVAGRVEMFR